MDKCLCFTLLLVSFSNYPYEPNIYQRALKALFHHFFYLNYNLFIQSEDIPSMVISATQLSENQSLTYLLFKPSVSQWQLIRKKLA